MPNSSNRSVATFLGFSLLICTALFGCGDESTLVLPPDRPENVPEDAVWVGGLDGGAFIALSRVSSKVVEGVVYNDTGYVFYRGRLEISDGEIDFPLNSVLAYEGWDGENIMLRDGRMLSAIDPYQMGDQER